METDNTKLVSMVPNGNDIRQAILDLAYEKFAEHGFKKVTMNEIASELAISKKTVYKYFASKEIILEEIVNQRLKRAEEVFKALLSHTGPADERIRMVAEMFPGFVDAKWQRLIADVIHSVPSVSKKIQAMVTYFITKVASSVLKDGQKNGVIRKDIDVDVFTMAYLGAAKELLNSDFLAKHPVTEEVIPKQIFRIFTEGILTEKGRKK